MRRYRSLKRTTAPAVEPITLSEAKSHIRVDTSTDDTLITGYIKTAREWVEDYIDRALITQRLVMTLDTFPEELALPRPPMANSGTSTAVIVTYVTGEAGGTATLATTDYRVDRDSTPGIIRNTYAGSWPSHLAVAEIDAPLSIKRVAAVCRMSCSRIDGTPAAAQCRANILE